MTVLEINELGDVIRKIRKQRGLRLEDLADENISPATISNIERGVPHVSMEKAMYLLEKLNIETSQVPHLLMQEEKELENVKLQLDIVESLWRMKQYEHALKKLEQLKLEDNHPLAAYATFLKGQCFTYKGHFKRAERLLYQAIKLANQHPYNQQTNVEAVSFLELGVCCYMQNDLDGAIRFTNSGIDAYKEIDDRPHLRFVLYRNKMVYLEKIGNINEGMRVMQEIWDSRHEVKEIETLLTFYWLHGEFHRRTNSNDEAVQYAREGLELAVHNGNQKYVFDFWTMLGCLYTSKGELEMAEECFDTALKVKDELPDKKTATTTFAKLGVLYLHQKRFAEAKEVISQAIENGEKYNDAPRLTYALMVMGDYMRKSNHIQDAIRYYQSALELAQKYNMKRSEYNLLFKLAECWNQVDEKEFIQCMRNMYEVKRVLKEREGDFFGELD